MLDKRTKVLFGSLLNAIGQTMAAVANTPAALADEEWSSRLDLWGNVLQGTGTALTVDSDEPFSYGTLGNELQAIGNVVTVMSFLVPVHDETKEELGQKGDIIETLGVVVSLPDELEEGFTVELFFDLFGNILQVIEIKDVDEVLLNTLSEWSQAIAAILSWLNELHADST